MAEGRFSRLPAAAISDTRVSSELLRTLAAVCVFANKEGACYPSVASIAKHARKSARQVRRDAHQLERLGYLSICRQIRDQGGFGSNFYIVRYPASPVTAGDQDESGGHHPSQEEENRADDAPKANGTDRTSIVSHRPLADRYQNAPDGTPAMTGGTDMADDSTPPDMSYDTLTAYPYQPSKQPIGADAKFDFPSPADAQAADRSIGKQDGEHRQAAQSRILSELSKTEEILSASLMLDAEDWRIGESREIRNAGDGLLYILRRVHESSAAQ